MNVDERLRWHDLDVDLELRMAQVDAGSDALEHESAELAVQLDARHRVGLERPPRGDPERREALPLDEPGDDRLHRLDGRGDAIRKREARDPEHTLHTVTHGGRIGVIFEVEQDPARDLAERQRPQIGRRASEIPGQMAQEERAVAALEPELVVVHEADRATAAHVSRARPRARGRARARPGYSRS